MILSRARGALGTKDTFFTVAYQASLCGPRGPLQPAFPTPHLTCWFHFLENLIICWISHLLHWLFFARKLFYDFLGVKFACRVLKWQVPFFLGIFSWPSPPSAGPLLRALSTLSCSSCHFFVQTYFDEILGRYKNTNRLCQADRVLASCTFAYRPPSFRERTWSLHLKSLGAPLHRPLSLLSSQEPRAWLVCDSFPCFSL